LKPAGIGGFLFARIIPAGQNRKKTIGNLYRLTGAPAISAAIHKEK
jgi:hypothetical protein|tara:strand:- start:513 stop:650 length:138 start_codon:yes stop_codon:yes gene_type:complete